ncbi:MAG: DNA-3-methyladenine glycosylase I [Thermoplasmata archaeon]
MAEEHTSPKRISPRSLDDYLEVMSKAVFQTGMSWKVVKGKWPDIRAAMEGFNVGKVARLDENDLERLVKDKRVIRNRRKLEAIVHNARKMIELDKHYDGFQDYLRSRHDFDATVRSLRAQFKFLGEMGCYYFLYVVGEEVPPPRTRSGALPADEVER